MNATQAALMGLERLEQQAERNSHDAGAAQVRAIRRDLDKLMRGGWRDAVDQQPNSRAVVIRDAMSYADILGLSGEDRYAFLAHQALEALANCQRAYIGHMNLCPGVPITLKIR